MNFFSRVGMAVALAGAGTMLVAPQPALAKKEKKNKQDAAAGPKASNEYAVVYTPNKILLDTGDFEQLKTNLPELEAAIVNESDALFHGDLVYKLGKILQDRDIELAGIAKMIDNKFLPPANKPVFTFIQGKYAFDSKNNDLAATKLLDAYNLGYKDNSIELYLGYAYNRLNNAPQSVDWFDRYIISSELSGREIDTNAILGAMGIAAIRSRDLSIIDKAYKKILPRTTDNKLWHDGLSQLIQTETYSAEENLDILRLMDANNSLLFEREYVDYASIADPRRLPNEVLTVLNKGIAKNIISGESTVFKEHINTAQSRIAEDKADLARAEKDAQKTSSSGVIARAAGDAFLSHNKYPQAINLYKLAIEKGGVDVDRVLTRLGIAQTMSGDYEGGIASFAALTSPNRKNIGAYWTIYTKNLQRTAK